MCSMLFLIGCGFHINCSFHIFCCVHINCSFHIFCCFHSNCSLLWSCWFRIWRFTNSWLNVFRIVAYLILKIYLSKIFFWSKVFIFTKKYVHWFQDWTTSHPRICLKLLYLLHCIYKILHNCQRLVKEPLYLQDRKEDTLEHWLWRSHQARRWWPKLTDL